MEKVVVTKIKISKEESKLLNNTWSFFYNLINLLSDEDDLELWNLCYDVERKLAKFFNEYEYEEKE